MNKRFFIFFLLFLFSCTSNDLIKKQISNSKNDKLCNLLGQYAKNQFFVYDIIKEIEKRKKNLDEDRCYLIANKNKHFNNYITYKNKNFELWLLNQKKSFSNDLDLKSWNKNLQNKNHELIEKKIKNLKLNTKLKIN